MYIICYLVCFVVKYLSSRLLLSLFLQVSLETHFSFYSTFKMAGYFTRAVVRPPGYYRALHNRSSADTYAVENTGSRYLSFDEEDVYEVERLVQPRRKKVSLLHYVNVAYHFLLIIVGWNRVPSAVGRIPEGGRFVGQRTVYNAPST